MTKGVTRRGVSFRCEMPYSDGYGCESCVTEREGPGKRGPSLPESNAGGASATLF